MNLLRVRNTGVYVKLALASAEECGEGEGRGNFGHSVARIDANIVLSNGPKAEFINGCLVDF